MISYETHFYQSPNEVDVSNRMAFNNWKNPYHINGYKRPRHDNHETIFIQFIYKHTIYEKQIYNKNMLKGKHKIKKLQLQFFLQNVIMLSLYHLIKFDYQHILF